MPTILEVEQYVQELQLRTNAEILVLSCPKETNLAARRLLGRASLQDFSLQITDLSQGNSQRFFLGTEPRSALRNLQELARKKRW